MPIIAFTLDDAPSVDEPGVPFDAERMDRCREVLTRSDVAHCVAFVVGARAGAHEGALERWLAAGFELGNHTSAHEPASGQSRQRFADSLGSCDELLRRLGAFPPGRPKWFRFPLLDRGRDPAHRRELELECERLGYRIAPATIDLLDYPFEAPLAAAIARGDERGARRVEQRFLRSCGDAIEAAHASFEGEVKALPHVAYAHFGPVADRSLSSVLDLLRSRGFELCSLSSALDHPVYADYLAELGQSGLVLPARTALRSRIRRRLAIAIACLSPFDRRRYGPYRAY